MTQNATDTASVLAGIDQEEAARAAAAQGDGTATGKEAGEPSEEQKAAQAAEEEAARKAEEAKKSDGQKIGRTIRDLKKERREAYERAHKAEIEKARLEGELEALKRTGAKPAEGPKDEPPVRPKIEEFESVQDFNAALLTYTDEVTAYTRKQLQAETDKKIEEFKKTIPAPTPVETPQQKAEREIRENRDTALTQVQKEFGEDAVEVLTSEDFRMTPIMRDSILERENSTKILGFLAGNPDVAAKISSLSLTNQIREIDKLETSIMAKKTTQAPAPTTPVDGKGGGGNKPVEKMSAEELNTLMYGG